MPHRYILPTIFLLTWKKIQSTKVLTAMFVGFPAALIVFWARDSYETALKFFLILFPHIFLLASQDMVRTEVESGFLENGLFAGGRYKRYLRAKSLATASIVSVYVFAIFFVLALSGYLSGCLEVQHIRQFIRGLAAGWYYGALGGVLSHFLRGGSNVLCVLLGQAGLFLSLILLGPGHWGILDYLETGRFPNWISRASFGFLTALFPNVIISWVARRFVPEIIAGAMILVVLQKRLVGRLELKGRGEGLC